MEAAGPRNPPPPAERVHSDGHLRRALAAARAAAWDCDLATGVLRCPSEPDQQWGIVPGVDGPYATFVDRVDPLDRVALERAITAAIAERSNFMLEVRLVHDGGSPQWIACAGAATYDDDGAPTRLHGTVVDITARRRAQLAARCQSKVLECIGGGASLSEALEVLARGVESQLSGVRCSILLMDAQGKHLRHAAGPSLPAEYISSIDGAPIGPKAGACGTAAFRHQIVYCPDIANDPLWDDYRHLALPHDLRACWSTPIPDAEGQVVGTFALYRAAVGMPDEWQVELIRMATHAASIAIRSERSRDDLRSLGGRLLQAQDMERRRIARELHDTTVQHLAALGMNLAVLERRDGDSEVLAECQRLVKASADELRTLSYVLHPPMLEDFGLERAVQEFVEEFERRSGVEVDLIVEGDTRRVDRDVELALFRVLQESLSNVHRHSGSATAVVRLRCDATEVTLEIEDAGAGWGAAGGRDALSARGVGLVGMRERLRGLGGRVELEPGVRGARVRAIAPAREAGG